MATQRPILTFTTDFGDADGYVGTVKGVTLGISPDAQLVDISHDIGPQNVAEGAFVLYRAYRYFPPHSVHVAVVDPGVGSSRRPLLLQTAHGAFVGPDNGLFTYVLRAELAEALGLSYRNVALPPAWVPGLDVAALTDEQLARPGVPLAYELSNPAYWLQSISTTFHGRDIFGPSAAHLAAGVPAAQLGRPIPLSQLTLLQGGAPAIAPGQVRGHIIHIDRFGNLITNIHEALLRELGNHEQLMISLPGIELRGLRNTYAEVGEGAAVALIGSEHLLEIGVRNGSAAASFKAQVGDAVICSR